jgi:hypothetical protein
MSNDRLAEPLLRLDERNLAHVLSAVTLAALVPRSADGCVSDTCRWCSEGFVLTTRASKSSLFDIADEFVRRIRWVPGLGPVQQGTFATSDEIGFNPFWLLAGDAREGSSAKRIRSPFKAFSAQVKPGTLLNQQQQVLQPPAATDGWLAQLTVGVGSWGFDCRVGSHAYDQGFSSNEEGSGNLDPIYPATELLSIAAASFFCAVHAWQSDDLAVRYSVWRERLCLSLVPYAVTGKLEGLRGRRYRVSNRGAAYGKGAAYRFFPEAEIDD